MHIMVSSIIENQVAKDLLVHCLLGPIVLHHIFSQGQEKETKSFGWVSNEFYMVRTLSINGLYTRGINSDPVKYVKEVFSRAWNACWINFTPFSNQSMHGESKIELSI